ncbi:MAG TPA: 4-(cytidine 5'-diphospho)-2-C-methyl-D-erythritol kinase [Puia sp.]|nr:4-(cytidine 5'-diphospho)-2-C-methyl-D-erythritol kinase [Puia sp.]
MLFFPNCKLNLGLRILRRRPDGYHDLETIFYPLPLRDALECQPIKNGLFPIFSSYGLPIPGDPANNLCLKAWRLLKQDFPDLPPVHLHLLKNIPIGAGLGGGSADGAWTLKALNTQFHLGLSQEKLLQYAGQLGSDCPFFILNAPCIGTGRGEQLTPVNLDLSAYTFALVDPGIHISTASAFAGCTPAENTIPLTSIISQPIPQWRDRLVNDFEAPVFELHPELKNVKPALYTHGALYASLTGSGSSFFGIFPKDQAPDHLDFHFSHNYRILR